MKNAARLEDLSTHEGIAVEASMDVFVNMLGWVRLGDKFGGACSNMPVITSSMSVFANNIGVARIEDELECGATISTASPDTFAGD